MKPPVDSLQVVCAVISNEVGEILACQRCATTSLAGKWEFAGGKIEAGESKKEAILREIQEELGVSIYLHGELQTVEHQYPGFHVSLHPFLCRIEAGREPQALEHESLQWVKLDDAGVLDWAEADKVVLSQILQIS